MLRSSCGPEGSDTCLGVAEDLKVVRLLTRPVNQTPGVGQRDCERNHASCRRFFYKLHTFGNTFHHKTPSLKKDILYYTLPQTIHTNTPNGSHIIQPLNTNTMTRVLDDNQPRKPNSAIRKNVFFPYHDTRFTLYSSLPSSL